MVCAGLTLAFGTVLVFQIIDSQSHSNSDTIRPFVITMGPVWLVAALAGWELIGRRPRS